MKKPINNVRLEGRVYQYDLSIKTVKNENSKNYGKNYITGSLDVATDDKDDNPNIVTTTFTYVAENTSKGNKNNTYTTLEKIINEGKSWVMDGKENATKVRIDGSLALNDFYPSSNNGELVSQRITNGSFVNIINAFDENKRNKFEGDLFITSVVRKEPEDKPEYVEVRGALFNFKNDLLPYTFIVTREDGMNYFESLEVTKNSPVFTKVWGEIVCASETTKVVEESAFGEASVKTYTKRTKEWIITGTNTEPYEVGDTTTGITIEEVQKAMADREVYLAEKKKNAEDYRASQSNSPSPAAAVATNAVPAGNFNF